MQLKVFGIAFSFGLGLFRIPFYIVEVFLSFFQNQLTHNPYLWDSLIFFPLLLDEKLVRRAKESPINGYKLSWFLRTERRYQNELSFRLLMTSTPRLFRHYPLDWEYFPFLRFNEEYTKKFRKELPTERWLELYEELETMVYEKRMKQEAVETIQARGELERVQLDLLSTKSLVEKLIQETELQPNHFWKPDFLEGFQALLLEAEERIQKLEKVLRLQEKICRNRFRIGEPLDQSKKNLFLGRNDFISDLLKILNSSDITPTFYIWGQRRVGKTSLIKPFNF